MLFKLAGAVTCIYGLVSITGGAIGAHLLALPGLPFGADEPSMTSFYAGGAAGLVLIVCGIGLFRRSRIAAWGAVLVSCVLLGARFVPSVVKNRDDLAGFLDKTAGKITVAMIVCGIFTIVLAGQALVPPKNSV
jgi:hypothetical protein